MTSSCREPSQKDITLLIRLRSAVFIQTYRLARMNSHCIEKTVSYSKPYICMRSSLYWKGTPFPYSLPSYKINLSSGWSKDCTFFTSLPLHACLVMYLWKSWHDDVIKWKHFPRYWPFVWGVHRWPVKSPHKGRCFLWSVPEQTVE